MSVFRRQSRKAPIIICIICTLLVAGLYRIGFVTFGTSEFYAQDVALQFFGKREPINPQIVFLSLESVNPGQFSDEEIQASPALQLMSHTWPWPRAVYPMIFQRLFDSGAKVVAMDMLFLSETDNDAGFAEALEKYRDKVVIGSNFFEDFRQNIDLKTLQLPSTSLIPMTTPLDDRIGYVNFWGDWDLVLRRAKYRTTQSMAFHDAPQAGEEVYYSLAARAVQKFGRPDLIPAGTESHRIRFAGPPDTFEHHAIYNMFLPKIWNSPEFDGGKLFKDKIVLIGAYGNSLKDTVETPYKSMPGPEMHLNAINALLNGGFVRETEGFVNYLLIAGAGLMAWGLCVYCRSPLLRLGLLVLAIFLWFVVAELLFNFASLYLFSVPPLLALGSSGILGLSWDFFMEQRDKARVRGTLERYVSKHAVREIIDNPSSYFNTLGGVRKPVAVFFSDLRGFTSMTEEAADSHAVITQLNEYFDVMVAPVLANRGCLDKLIGDAIMAVWGNIQSLGPKGDVCDAIDSALQMRAALPKLNEEWIAAGKKPLAMGMGINFGEVIVGNLGSKQQMNFTVIGDTVNLGSRIEGTTKEYGVDLLVGEDAAKLVTDEFLMQTAGLTQVKGRKKPVELFYVIGRRPAVVEPRQEEYLHVYGEGIALYIKGDFVAAGEKFKRSLELHPPDALARVYIERCSILAKGPVPEGWNGVFVMKGK